MIALSLVALAGARAEPAAAAKPAVDGDGTVHLPAFAVPLSSYMSSEAKQHFKELAANPPMVIGEVMTSIAKLRKAVDDRHRLLVEEGKALYPVNIEQQTLAQVRVDIVTPKQGVAPRQRDRVLINMHGGGFTVGAAFGGLVESIPVAAVGGIKVVSVDYRLGPEHKFPAASEDVAAVYKELLQQYRPENIGLYGCSAGGALAGQAVAWFQKHDLPRPGAIGMFCAGDVINGGDSRYLASPVDVSFAAPEPPPAAAPNPPPPSTAYFSEVSVRDPLVSPVTSPQVLARFPPTLLISGTRDLALSSVVNMHTQLVKAGVDADLHVWEGMGHGFLTAMNLPESKEAYDVIVRFFDRHLGTSAR